MELIIGSKPNEWALMRAGDSNTHNTPLYFVVRDGKVHNHVGYDLTRSGGACLYGGDHEPQRVGRLPLLLAQVPGTKAPTIT